MNKNTRRTEQAFYIFTETGNVAIPVMCREEFESTAHNAEALNEARHDGADRTRLRGVHSLQKL